MNLLTNLLGRFTKIAALAAVACTLGLSQSRAADIKFEAKVAGYTQRGNGWVLVLPERRPILGGKVAWDQALGTYVTDRVARGETMRVTITPGTRTEKCYRIALEGIAPGNTWTYDKLVPLPYTTPSFEVSKSPAFSNMFVNIFTFSGPFSKRIPIGSR